MKITVNSPKTEVVPVSYVTKDRQRLSQYGNSVYLSNNDSFELELFNPTSDKVLAKIDLDGKSLGSGIILRPGERVFLERFLDSARKFLFETYTIDGGNQDAVDAISKNGTVDVKFFKERAIPQQSYPYINYINYSTVPYTNAPTLTVFPVYTTGLAMTGGNSTLTVENNIASKSSVTMDILNHERTLFCTSFDSPKDIETGRVEKGEHSSQSFTYNNTIFNSWHSWISSWKILPLSQRIITKKDIKIYCSSCGKRKRKNSDKFCSSCGTEY